MSGAVSTTLPVEPLEQAIAASGHSLIALFGSRSASWYRARARGRISADLADWICIEVLGIHPAELYGARW